MKTYLILMMGAFALAHAAEMPDYSFSAPDSGQHALARKAGGRKYRLPYMLKKLKKNRQAEKKACTA